MHYTKAYAFQLIIQWGDQMEMASRASPSKTSTPNGSIPTHIVPEPSPLTQIYTIYTTKI